MQFTSTWQPGDDIFSDITNFFNYLDSKYGKEATHEALVKAVKGTTLKEIKQIVYEALGTKDNKEIKTWAEAQGLTVNLRTKASWQSILDAYREVAAEAIIPIEETQAVAPKHELPAVKDEEVQVNPLSTTEAAVESAPVKKDRKPRKSKKAA